MLTSKLGHQGDSPPVAISGGNRVAVMQPAKSRQRDDLALARRRRRRNSTVGRVLPQSEMSWVFVVIADIFFQQPSQMSLVQNNHVIQQVSAHASNPTLGDAILPGTAKSRTDRFRAMLFDGRDESAENFASRSKIKNR